MIARFVPNRLLRMTSIALAMALFLATSNRATPCRAGLIIELSNNVTARADSTGSFDVILFNDPSTGTTATAPHVAGFTVQLALQGLAGVTFNGATTATAGSFAGQNYGYIFQLSTVDLLGVPLSDGPFPATSFVASDNEFADPGYRLINPKDVYGLVHVTYVVAASAAPGTGAIHLVTQGTSLSDETSNAVPFTTRDGTFTINSVPGPGSLALSLTGLVGGILSRRRWRSGRLR